MKARQRSTVAAKMQKAIMVFMMYRDGENFAKERLSKEILWILFTLGTAKPQTVKFSKIFKIILKFRLLFYSYAIQIMLSTPTVLHVLFVHSNVMVCSETAFSDLPIPTFVQLKNHQCECDLFHCYLARDWQQEPRSKAAGSSFLISKFAMCNHEVAMLARDSMLQK